MNKKLGRGLAEIFKDSMTQDAKENEKNEQESQKNLVNFTNLNISSLISNSEQPRKNFNQNSLLELSESIKNHGVLQPILVLKQQDGLYKIISGERRWRASKLAGLQEIPAIIIDKKEKEEMVIGLLENIQREELNCIEEAEGYAFLIDKFSYTQEEVSKIVSKSRSHISNMLRLNSLELEVKQAIIENKITMGHARCLIGASDQVKIMNEIIDNNLNVREAEKLLKKHKAKQNEDISNSNYDVDDNLHLSKKTIKSKKNIKNGSDDEDLNYISQVIEARLNIKAQLTLKNGEYILVCKIDDLSKLDSILDSI